MQATASGHDLGDDDKLLRLRKIEEGTEQEVRIDPRTLLARVMAALGSEPPRLLSETNCGEAGVKIAIQLELPFGSKGEVTICEGAPSKTRSIAEKNAILVALRHLDHNCHVNVVDFSSRVARSVGASKTYRCLSEAMSAVQKMLLDFEKTLGKFKELAIDFEDKINKQRTLGQPSGSVLVYVGISSFLASIVERFSLKASESLSKFESLEKQRIELKQKVMGKASSMAKKRHTNTVLLSTKFVLDYMLSYFGFERATYANGPVDDDSVDAAVMFEIPRIKRLKLCGNLKIRGNGDTSASAEEDAAFQALLLMEKNLNIRVVDISHAHRVETEQLQSILVKLIKDVLTVADAIKNSWDQLMQEVAQHRDSCTYDNTVSNLGGKAEDQIIAYQISMQALDKLEQTSTRVGNEICWELYETIGRIKLQLDVIDN